ncbi:MULTISPECIES: hypothetical protein [unclassified Mucilaginibacter]|nr:MULTISPECIES: hypothetical protein [unclassified Mucilaginibacter]
MKKVLTLVLLVAGSLSASTTQNHAVKAAKMAKVEQAASVFRKDIGTAD